MRRRQLALSGATKLALAAANVETRGVADEGAGVGAGGSDVGGARPDEIDIRDGDT